MRRTAPPEAIREQISYDRDTGSFHWLVARPGVRKGAPAGNFQTNGYKVVRFQRISYLGSHLAWWFVTGEWPDTFVVDHINRNQGDDRFVNLRKATHSLNHGNERLQKNNKTGYRGVCKIFYRSRWQYLATIRNTFIGYHASAEDAARAYDAAALTQFGEFANLNFPR